MIPDSARPGLGRMAFTDILRVSGLRMVDKGVMRAWCLVGVKARMRVPISWVFTDRVREAR